MGSTDLVYHPDICYRCRRQVPDCQLAYVGWCIDCVNVHPATLRIIQWARLNGLGLEDVMPMIRRKFTAAWN